MTYSRYQQLKPEDFKRLYGVHHQTFTRMVAVLKEQVEQRKKKLGKPSKLSVEDQVLMSLDKRAGVPHFELSVGATIYLCRKLLLFLITSLSSGATSKARIFHPFSIASSAKS